MQQIGLENSTFSDFEIIKCESSRYLQPYRLKFKQNGVMRIWDGIKSHASVSCLIYNKEKKCLLLVRQFRPVVFISKLIEKQQPKSDDEPLDCSLVDPREGITYELCAGICDKSKSMEETVHEEIVEECGYQADMAKIYKIADTRLGVGLLGAMHSIYYTEVDESMRVSAGGGNASEGEFIDVYELPEHAVREFIRDSTSSQKPPGLLFALTWFLHEKDLFFLERMHTN